MLRHRRHPRYDWRTCTRWICLVGAAACFVWVGLHWNEQRSRQSADEAAFDRALDAPRPATSTKSASTPTAPAVPARRFGLAKLEIDRLHVSGFIEEGFDGATLGHAIGHEPGSAWPGETGNIVLAAHRDTFFAGLHDVEMGDSIRLLAPGGKAYQYKVTSITVVEPSAGWVLRSTANHDQLTLITCFPFHFVGSAPKRLIVQAVPFNERSSAT